MVETFHGAPDFVSRARSVVAEIIEDGRNSHGGIVLGAPLRGRNTAAEAVDKVLNAAGETARIGQGVSVLAESRWTGQPKQTYNFTALDTAAVVLSSKCQAEASGTTRERRERWKPFNPSHRLSLYPLPRTQREASEKPDLSPALVLGMRG